MSESPEFYARGYLSGETDYTPRGAFHRISHKLLERGVVEFFPSVLEVGADKGQHYQFVTHPFDAYTMSDILEPSSWIAQGDKLEYVKADVQNLPFANESFHRTISTCLLHHVQSVDQALEEMHRVTKPGGLISILVPSDPGILYRLGWYLFSRPKIKRYFGGDPMEHHLDYHRLRVDYIIMRIRKTFSSAEITETYWPFCLSSWNLNLFTVFQVRKKDH
jgi:phosphatidylethanolamine/phosphatidyl-N-methylethanolamine N-methyltransferase